MHVFMKDAAIPFVLGSVDPQGDTLAVRAAPVGSDRPLSLALPELRQQLAKAVLVADRQHNDGLSSIDARAGVHPLNQRADALELEGDAPGLFLTGVGDDDEVRAAQLDPSSRPACVQRRPAPREQGEDKQRGERYRSLSTAVQCQSPQFQMRPGSDFLPASAAATASGGGGASEYFR